MKELQMPKNLQEMIRSAWRNGDIESIAYFNRIWFDHVKEVREEYRREQEENLKQSEGEYL